MQARMNPFMSGICTTEGSTQRRVAPIILHKVQKNLITFIFQLSGLALVAPLCFALHC